MWERIFPVTHMQVTSKIGTGGINELLAGTAQN